MHFDFNLSLWKLNTLKSRLPTPHHFWILDGWEWKHPAILKPLAIFWTILGRGDCCFISEKKIKNKTKRFNKPFDFAKKKPKSSLGMERFPTRRCEISLHDNVRDNIIWDRIYLWVDGPSWEMSLGLCICACVCVCVCVCLCVCVCVWWRDGDAFPSVGSKIPKILPLLAGWRRDFGTGGLAASTWFQVDS